MYKKRPFLQWPQEKPAIRSYTRRIFAEVAPRYDLMKFLLSAGQEPRWKRSVLQEVFCRYTGNCLDLATGTGDIPSALADFAPGLTVTAIDISREMLTFAIKRLTSLSGRILQAELSALPFKEEVFHAVTVGYGLRYVPDLHSFFCHIYKLLKPGGVFLSFDLGIPRFPMIRKAWLVYLFFFGTVLGLTLHGRFSSYWHLVETLRQYPGQEEVASILVSVGFHKATVLNIVGGTLAVHIAHKE